MFATVLAAYYAQFEMLAQSWLEQGATAFAAWADGRPLACWPAAAVAEPAAVRAEVYYNHTVIGELRVAGRQTAAAQAQLRAEAQLLSHLVRLTRNVHSVTAELVHTQDQLLALYDLNQAARNSLEMEPLLNALAQKACDLLDVEGAFLLVEIPQQPLFIAHYPQPIVDATTIEYSLNILRATGERVLLDQEDVVQQNDLHNFLLLPIWVRGSIDAALGLINKRTGNFLSPDIKLARAVADHVGARVENVLLHEQSVAQTRLQTEVELAQRVQLRLLPRQVPQVDGLDLWARSRPATQVGGDFYDFVVRPGRPLSFAVGDISGKGLPAALLMAMTRTVIRTKSSGLPEPTPQTVLARSNEELYEDFTGVNMFATVFVGQYDAARQELLYANAGHSPVIFRPRDGRAELLQADSTAIGILPQNRPRDFCRVLRPGDVLVVATDGLNEAQDGEERMYGYEKLLETVDRTAAASARVIGETVYASVSEFSNGHPQRDDQTLLVLKGVAV